VVCGVAFVSASACSNSSSAPAATVNGVEIPTKDLVDELNAIGANGDYVATYQGNVHGSTPGSFDAAFVAQTLVQQINYAMLHAEYAKRNLQPNDECKQQARNEVLLQLGNGDADKGQSLFDKFGRDYQDLLVRRNVELLAVTYDLDGQTCPKVDNGPGYYEAHPEAFTKVCIQAIAVADQATADTVVAQARGGADFAQLASATSIDEQSKATGGDIGCAPPSQYTPTVAAALEVAKVGDVLDPFSLQQGFAVFKVYDIQPLSLQEAQTSAEELATLAINRNIDIAKWIRQARSGAVITVDARYGTFDTKNFTIDPPASSASSGSGSSSSSSTDAP
jgi:parvulin-like peptidyl-prolyl isomerase